MFRSTFLAATLALAFVHPAFAQDAPQPDDAMKGGNTMKPADSMKSGDTMSSKMMMRKPAMKKHKTAMKPGKPMIKKPL